jgi:rhodanese-related sulfurtransferase
MDATLSSISVAELKARLGRADAPILLDVRQEPGYQASPILIAGARRIAPEAIGGWATAQPRDSAVIVYCAHGNAASQSAAAALARAGLAASYLAGGLETWRSEGGATLRKDQATGIGGTRPTRWVTRERPKIDRIACPWLINRFIDPAAEFLYAPPDQVRDVAARDGAIPYDVPGVRFTHDGEFCSFDTLMHEFALEEPGLAALARIVRGADTARLDLAPQAPGLLAITLGLSANIADDHAMLKSGMVIYDALYRWCRDLRSEAHDWTYPPAPRATA